MCRTLGLLTLIFVLGGGVLLAGTVLQATELRVTGTHLLSVPAFSSWGQAQCDDAHGLYYRPVISGVGPNSSVVMKLDWKSEAPTVYKLPPELGQQRTALMDFFVIPSSHVSFLDQMQDGHYTILTFDSDGDMSSKVDLQILEGLLLDRFAVAEDGVAPVGGFFPKGAAKDLQGHQYLGIVDRLGKERRRFESDALKKLNLVVDAATTIGNPVVAGNDGNFYYVEGNKVLVISEWGDVVRDMSFDSPSVNAFPVSVALSDGLLSLQFNEKDKSDPHLLRPEFLVLETATGAPFALYRPSDELGTVCLCFSRSEGYLFQKIKNGKLNLLTAELR